MFSRVLLCYDGSDECRRALKRSAELVIQIGAQVHVLCIVPSEVNLASMISISSGYGGGENVESAYQQLLRDSIEKLKARGVTAQGYLAQGDAIDEIAKCAERLSIDLIVLGDYPRAVGGRWWAGSQSRTLADRTRCSILIAR